MNSKAALAENQHFDKEIDLSGLNCPLPILKTKAALATMAQGEVLKVIVTNKDSVREIQHFGKQMRTEVHLDTDAEGKFILYFRKQ